jgi:hypothetical protein
MKPDESRCVRAAGGEFFRFPQRGLGLDRREAKRSDVRAETNKIVCLNKIAHGLRDFVPRGRSGFSLARKDSLFLGTQEKRGKAPVRAPCPELSGGLVFGLCLTVVDTKLMDPRVSLIGNFRQQEQVSGVEATGRVPFTGVVLVAALEGDRVVGPGSRKGKSKGTTRRAVRDTGGGLVFCRGGCIQIF